MESTKTNELAIVIDDFFRSGIDIAPIAIRYGIIPETILVNGTVSVEQSFKLRITAKHEEEIFYIYCYNGYDGYIDNDQSREVIFASKQLHKVSSGLYYMSSVKEDDYINIMNDKLNNFYFREAFSTEDLVEKLITNEAEDTLPINYIVDIEEKIPSFTFVNRVGFTLHN